jgi:hypothetical protein
VPSRGSIIPRILEEQDGVGPSRLPETLDFSAYPSFTLLVTSSEGGELVRFRRGSGIERERIRPGWTFLTSSSWNEPDVALWRSRAFDAWRDAGTPETLGIPSLHLLAPAGQEAVAPFMTRKSSGTRSITQVRVDTARSVASLIWWPRGEADEIDPSMPCASLDLELAPSPVLPAENRRR